MIKDWAADMANQGIALIASLLMRSAIKPLLEIDEKSLRAVGLSHADVVECLSTPFTTDPTEFLTARGKIARRDRGIRWGQRRSIRRRTLALQRATSRARKLQPGSRRFFSRSFFMARILALIFVLASLALLLVTIPDAIGFVGDFAVPGTINTGAVPLSEASFNNLRLLPLFAIRHGVMARKSFRRWRRRYIPASLERSTCVLISESR